MHIEYYIKSTPKCQPKLKVNMETEKKRDLLHSIVISADGEWCAWTSWSTCSRSCGQGIINRTRVCACPEPTTGGSICRGPNEECKDCNNTGCPGSWPPFFMELILLLDSLSFCIITKK